MIGTNDNVRLEAYLQAETKYRVVPVPTPVDRSQAALIANAALAKFPDGETTEKLSRLAILHDLRETAKGFQTLLRRSELESGDLPRGVACLAALAWLGNDEQFVEARRQYSALLTKVDWDSQRQLALRAGYSLGPRESAESLRTAVRSVLNSLQAQLKDSRSTKTSSAQVETLESRHDRLEEFLNLDVARLDQANRFRSALEHEPEDKQVSSLCSLYVADSLRSTPPQAEWAAYKLVRSKPELHSSIADRFLALAVSNDKKDPPRQLHFDLCRARALRAAEYFALVLDAPARQWLVTQKDHGTDLLALRPDWEYPGNSPEK